MTVRDHKHSKESTKILTAIITEYHEISGYKITIQKNFCMYIGNKQSEYDIKGTSQFIII